MTSSTTDPPTSLPYPEGVPREGDVVAGRYRIERTLGIGGMGVVVAAMHLDLDERVAIKFLASSTRPGPDAIARFVREAKAAIKIRSDHVVRVLDSGKLESGAPFIVMEYLEGRDLQGVLEQQGALAVEHAVDYLLQACDAIAAAHALGIVHRDLKPGNLFLTRRSDGSALVKVLDFGISKVMDGAAISGSGLTSTTAIMGTPAFMSPEQLRSTSQVDPRADIWSMGTILYALLAGEPPYSGESTADIAVKIIRDAPPPLREKRPDVPEGLEAVIERCLEKEPDARYAGVAELAEALLPFASEVRRASAHRITKQISARQLGAAPTLVSGPTPELPRVEPGEPATRTANAWGKPASKPSVAPPKRRPFLAGILVAAAVSAAGATFVIVKVRTAGEIATPVASDVTANAAPVAAAVPVSQPLPAPVPAPPPPSPPAPSSMPPAAAPTIATSVAPPPSPRIAQPSHSSSKGGARSTGGAARSASATATPSAPAAATPAPAPSAGLFDDRE